MIDKKINIMKALDNCFDIIWEIWKKEDNEEVKTKIFNIMEELTKIIDNTEDELTNMIMNNKG